MSGSQSCELVWMKCDEMLPRPGQSMGRHQSFCHCVGKEPNLLLGGCSWEGIGCYACTHTSKLTVKICVFQKEGNQEVREYIQGTS